LPASLLYLLDKRQFIAGLAAEISLHIDDWNIIHVDILHHLIRERIMIISMFT
jgi:hypothetical protein